MTLRTSLLALVTCALFTSVTSLAWANPWPSAPSGAQLATAEDEGDPRVVTTLLVDAATVAPGDTVRVGVHFAMDPHWHVYWSNPGQGAYATEVQHRSAGDAGPLQWPAPSIFTTSDGFITTYGYEDEVVLFYDWTVPADATGTATLDVVADFLTCEVDCIPGRTELTRDVPVSAATTPPDTPTRAAFDAAAATVPTAVDDIASTEAWLVPAVSAIAPGETVRIVWSVVTCRIPLAEDDLCPAIDLEASRYIPDRTPSVEWLSTRLRPHPSAYRGVLVELTGRASPDVLDDDAPIGGVLVLAETNAAGPTRERALALDGAVPRVADVSDVTPIDDLVLADLPALDEVGGDDAPTLTMATTDASATAPPARPPMPLWQAILFGLLGGALLNLMPCVLPVLALKVTGFARLAHDEDGAIGAHALAYAGGVIGSMLALAGAVIALQQGGAAVGWGFQFQHPPFVAAIAAIVVLFAANLFGAWTLTLDASRLDAATRERHGVSRSALEGVLTVVLATPCSAPLLGTAIGFALAAGPATTLATFAAVGVGLAAPFVILTLIPGAARIVPRPGPWMDTLKHALAFALLATAAWLGWVFGQLTDADALGRLVAWLLAVSLVAWLFGRAQRRGGLWPIAVAVVGIAAVVGLGRVALPTEAGQGDGATAHVAEGWVPWSEDAVATAIAEGRPVFVDFTADWCITCKVNERTVLADERITAAAAEHDVVRMIADWTARDDRIRDELARHGRAGVPVYLMYGPGAPSTPEILPEVLTVDRVVRAFEDAPR